MNSIFHRISVRKYQDRPGRCDDLRFNSSIIRKAAAPGVPIALQDFLAGISFLVLPAFVKGSGLSASARTGRISTQGNPLTYGRSCTNCIAVKHGSGKGAGVSIVRYENRVNSFSAVPYGRSVGIKRTSTVI